MIKEIFYFFYLKFKKIVESFGLDLSIRRVSQDGGYETVLPTATYAPWLLDKDFKLLFEVVRNCTLVDKYRCYELFQLVAESKKLEGALIEIGVWRGGTGAIVAKAAALNNIQDMVYLCDNFEGVVKAGAMDSSYEGGEHKDTSKEIVEELVYKVLNLRNVKILAGIFPNETGHLVNNERFRFCHIDVDVYQSAKDVIDWLWPRIVKGGIVVYDDYGSKVCDGITKLVNEGREKEDRIVIHNLNGHAIVIKI